LPQHLIDEGRLAVVDVGDDGHIADIAALHAEDSLQEKQGPGTLAGLNGTSYYRDCGKERYSEDLVKTEF
jgi:hypothetical protein